MRLTGVRELESLYRELEGVGFYPSIPYVELIQEFREERIYISKTRLDIRLKPGIVELTFCRFYPEQSFLLTFTKEIKHGRPTR